MPAPGDGGHDQGNGVQKKVAVKAVRTHLGRNRLPEEGEELDEKREKRRKESGKRGVLINPVASSGHDKRGAEGARSWGRVGW